MMPLTNSLSFALFGIALYCRLDSVVNSLNTVHNMQIWAKNLLLELEYEVEYEYEYDVEFKEAKFIELHF